MKRVAIRTLAVAAVCMSLRAAPAVAHDLTITQVVAVVKADGTFLIDMRVNVDALALGLPSSVHAVVTAPVFEEMTPEEMAAAAERARNTILHRVHIRFDGEKVVPLVIFPEREHPLPEPGTEPLVLGQTALLTGRFPKDANEFTFGASRAFGALQLTIFDEANASGAKYVLGVGEDAPPFRLHQAIAPKQGFAFARYLLLGFEHILPRGLDHILFVLGLYLLSTRLRPLLLQITSFTVAHSVTLALSMTGIASLPSGVVEPLIAVSIAYVAIENVIVTEMKPWRPVVVFMFGLLHGMGFAGVLHELGLPKGEFVPALVGFNLGVEFGQLAVVLGAFLVLGWFRKRKWYRNGIVRPLSVAIALVGMYWAVQRVGLIP